MNTTILVLVLAIYFLGMIGIGLLGRKKYGQSFEALITAGRNVGVLMFAGSAIGAHIGNGFVVGGAADGAALGISGVWYGIACALSYLVVAFLMNKRIYQKGFITLPDFLQERYHDKTTSLIFSLATTIGYIGFVGVQIMAGKALFTALGLDGNLGAIIITLVVLAYSTLSGLWGAYATSVVQVAIITVGLIITSIILLAKGGVSTISSAIASGALPMGFQDILPEGIGPILMMFIPITMGVMADQCTIQRVNSSKSEKTAMRGWILSVVLMLPLALMPAFIGMYGAAAFAASGNGAFFVVIMETLHPVVAAVMIAAVLAAIMSTCDSLLVGFSTVLLHDIYRGMINPKATDKALTVADRVITAVAAGFALLIALVATNIVDLLILCDVFIASCIFVPFIGGLFWKGGTRKGAVGASIVGLIVVLLNLTQILPLPYSEVTPTVCSLIAYIAISLATKETKLEARA